MMASRLRLAVFIFPFAAIFQFTFTSLFVHADLAFTASGTDLFASEYVDDVVDDRSVLRSTGLSNFRFFGNALSPSIHVSENGNISTTQNIQFFPNAHGNVVETTKLIAPLWDDVLLIEPTNFPAGFPRNYVLEQKQAGLYAVTWQNIRLLNETVAGQAFPSTIRSAQLALIGTAQTLKGFAFKPNDIVFSYQSYDGTTKEFVDVTRGPSSATHLNAFVGLADTTGGTGASGEYSHVVVDGQNIDADASGYVEADEAAGDGSGGRLPWNNLEFILFREQLDSSGDFVSYDVTIERFTAVPEPGVLPLVCIGLFCCVARRRQRA